MRARATPRAALARVTEQCAAGCSANGGIPNLTYRSANWGHSWDAQYTWRASVSYVTGAHNLKIGYGGVALVSDLENHTNDLNLAYTVSNGVPISLTQSLLPFTTSYRTRNMSFYVQDQWTLGRMTLQGALRFDRNWSFSPEQTHPGVGTSSPTPIVFPETPGVTGYKDISPRGGVAYDLFGNGKTAVKVNFGKYLEPTSNNNNYILSNPIGRIATTAARGWTDSNGNFVAGLRPAESGGAEPDGDRWRHLRGDATRRRSARRRRPRRTSTRRFSAGGACGRTTGRSAPRSSSRCCRACRSRSATSAAG